MSGTLPNVQKWTADGTAGYCQGHTSGAETIDIAGSVAAKTFAAAKMSVTFGGGDTVRLLTALQ